MSRKQSESYPTCNLLMKSDDTNDKTLARKGFYGVHIKSLKGPNGRLPESRWATKSPFKKYVRSEGGGGVGTQTSVRKRIRGGGSLQRTYVRTCNFKSLLLAKHPK